MWTNSLGWTLPKSKAAGEVNLQSGKMGFLQSLGLLGPCLVSTVGEKDTLAVLVVTINES